MKTMKLFTIALMSICISSFTLSAQDDVYFGTSGNNTNTNSNGNAGNYSTYTNSPNNSNNRQVSPDNFDNPDSSYSYIDSNGNVTNNYYYNNYYDYDYTARLRRFYNPYDGFGYYSDIYTDYYWYNYNWLDLGISIYTGYAWWHPRPWGGGYGWSWSYNWGWNNWNNYGYSPYGGYYGYSYYNPWYGNYSWGWHHHHHYGWNNNDWGNGYNNNGWSNTAYYNSYDHNSNFYGHRGHYGNGRMTKPTNINSGKATTVFANNNLSSFGENYQNYIAKKNVTSNKTEIKNIKGGVISNNGNHSNTAEFGHSPNIKNVVKANTGIQHNAVIPHKTGVTVRANNTIHNGNYNNTHTVVRRNVTTHNAINRPGNIQKQHVVRQQKAVHEKPNYSQYSTPSHNYYKPNYNNTKVNKKPVRYNNRNNSINSYSRPTNNYSRPKQSTHSYSRPTRSYSRPAHSSRPTRSYSRPEQSSHSYSRPTHSYSSLSRSVSHSSGSFHRSGASSGGHFRR